MSIRNRVNLGLHLLGMSDVDASFLVTPESLGHISKLSGDERLYVLAFSDEGKPVPGYVTASDVAATHTAPPIEQVSLDPDEDGIVIVPQDCEWATVSLSRDSVLQISQPVDDVVVHRVLVTPNGHSLRVPSSLVSCDNDTREGPWLVTLFTLDKGASWVSFVHQFGAHVDASGEYLTSGCSETDQLPFCSTLGNHTVLGVPFASVDVQEASGYFRKEVDPLPRLKSNQYLESSIVMRYGRPVIEHRRRLKTLEEQVEDTAKALTLKEREELEALIPELTSIAEGDPRFMNIKDALGTISRALVLFGNELLTD